LGLSICYEESQRQLSSLPLSLYAYLLEVRLSFLKRSFYIFLFFSSFFTTASGQSNDLSSLEVSILTCGPGEDLYTLFGHSALRIKDTISGEDIVYNWGTFDFGEPGFANQIKFGFNFLKGKLPYVLGEARYNRFLAEYDYYGRAVTEQILGLSSSQKQELISALVINLQKGNRAYDYDFYFDNCVTRPRDMLEDVYGGLLYPDLEEQEKTFRDLLHENLTTSPWTELGMDLILGTQNDDIADERGQMFLPSYYQSYLAGAKRDAKNIVLSNKEILPQVSSSKKGWFTPQLLFWGLLILELIGSFLFYISGDRGFLKWYDRAWFLALGISSLIMIIMWAATEHTVCYNNYNLLWAGPWAWLYFKKGKTRNLSLWLTLLSSILVLLCWQIIPQALPLLVIPICLITAMKSLRLLGWLKKLDKAILKFASIALIILLQTSTGIGQKIDGVTLVSPPREYQTDPMPALTKVNADWVALVPYAFSRQDNPEVYFNTTTQWWGERVEGVETSIKYAKANNMKVMIKPQVWIHGMWVGDVNHKSETDWKIWEDSYKAYIMQFINLAAKYDIEMVCIGTEYRASVEKRETFWRNMIAEIRQIYNGKLTYSANWDDYDRVPFWDALDYIGISSYFPLSDMDTPPRLLLSYRWGKYVKKLRKLSQKWDRKILFTEYGYLSVDGAAGKTWKLEKVVNELDVNEQAQANGYDALLGAFWEEDFWAGGFLWKWFPEGYGREDRMKKEYTPKDKKAASVLAKWYGKSGR